MKTETMTRHEKRQHHLREVQRNLDLQRTSIDIHEARQAGMNARIHQKKADELRVMGL